MLKFAKIVNNIIEIKNKIDSHGLPIKQSHTTEFTIGNVYGIDDVECGPDTCVCCSINWNRYNITQLINEIPFILKLYERRSRLHERRSRSSSDLNISLYSL